MSQLRAYARAIALDADDVIVSWLPLYHDMGLIAGFVLPIVAGVPLVLISPFHWVREPAVLFRAVQSHRGTLSWLPNFAYNHCARVVRERDLQGIDLSRWRVVNCSEPVRDESHRLFLDRFRPYGFSERGLGSCYAMAEATFAVTASPVPGPPRVDWVQLEPLQREGRAVPAPAEAAGASAMTSSGAPIEGVRVAVIGEGGARLGDRDVGEILVQGDCLFEGYHRRPDLSATAIQDGWYHTGDLGYLADGELYVAGRKDDLIIVGGKNIHPGDLEAIAAEVPGLRPGRAVAFGAPDVRLGTQAVVMVCELAGDPDSEERRRIESELRRRIVHQTDVTLAAVRLVDGRWLVKTSSGKVARRANREKYLETR
jgi:acyl-CoA synthetase (AMP-forming)/AMP-acid ligase II